jgi:hypothetical protein
MTITYPDGTSVPAILLSRSADVLRAAVPDDDDVRVFNLVNGTWRSESCELVTIAFAWQGRPDGSVPTVTDCICSKQLAAKLIALLLNPEGDVLEEQLLYAFSSAGGMVAVQESGLFIN